MTILADIIAFFVYSYLCVSLEHTVYYIRGGTYYYRLTNPIMTAFPLYGVGAYTMILLNNYLNETFIANLHIIPQLIIKIFIFGFAASVIEYITGKYFGNAGKTANPDCRITGWDYSKEPLNIEGIVSFNHMIFWGILGLVITGSYPYLIKFLNCGLNCYGL